MTHHTRRGERQEARTSQFDAVAGPEDGVPRAPLPETAAHRIPPDREVVLETVLCGRNVEVPQHFREHVADKLSRLERYDHKIVRMEVQLSHEPNPRQAKNCQRVEITGRGRGPVVRGEGCSADFYCALDQAVARLEARLRRAHDRRRVSHGRRVPVSVARATGTITVDRGARGHRGGGDRPARARGAGHQRPLARSRLGRRRPGGPGARGRRRTGGRGRRRTPGSAGPARWCGPRSTTRSR